MIVDCATYRDGVRQDTAHDERALRETLESLREGEFIWIGMANPRSDEITRVAAALDLHPLSSLHENRAARLLEPFEKIGNRHAERTGNGLKRGQGRRDRAVLDL